MPILTIKTYKSVHFFVSVVYKIQDLMVTILFPQCSLLRYPAFYLISSHLSFCSLILLSFNRYTRAFVCVCVFLAFHCLFHLLFFCSSSPTYLFCPFLWHFVLFCFVLSETVVHKRREESSRKGAQVGRGLILQNV